MENILTEKFEESLFLCPVCKMPLYKTEKIFFCKNPQKNHTYDISKSGYVNLLPPGKKSNAHTGDDSVMISARKNFLSKGFYDKISCRAAEFFIENFENSNDNFPFVFTDAGCGDGYHTKNIYNTLKTFSKEVLGIGIDASKHGADNGAKNAKDCKPYLSFAAANIFNMPLNNSFCHGVFSLFAPVPDAECHRILKDNGLLLVCSSGKRHLWQMREILYGTPREYEVLDRTPKGFALKDKSALSYNISLSKNEISDLFTMTPFYYRCPKDGREKLLNTENLTTEISVEYRIYKKI